MAIGIFPEAQHGERASLGLAETRRFARLADMAKPARDGLERVGEAPLEIWDGAHNLAAVGYLLPRVPEDRIVVTESGILAPAGTEIFGMGWNLAMQENIEDGMLSRAYSYDALGSFVAMPIGQATSIASGTAPAMMSRCSRRRTRMPSGLVQFSGSLSQTKPSSK